MGRGHWLGVCTASCHVWPWTSSLTSMCLSWLLCKTGQRQHRPVREVPRRMWVLSKHLEQSPEPSSPRVSCFRGFRRLRLEAPPLPDRSPPRRAAAKVKDHLLSGLRSRDIRDPQPQGTVGTRPLHLVHSHHGSAWQTSALQDCHTCPQEGRHALSAEGHRQTGRRPASK